MAKLDYTQLEQQISQYSSNKNAPPFDLSHIRFWKMYFTKMLYCVIQWHSSIPLCNSDFAGRRPFSAYFPLSPPATVSLLSMAEEIAKCVAQPSDHVVEPSYDVSWRNKEAFHQGLPAPKLNSLLPSHPSLPLQPPTAAAARCRHRATVVPLQ